MQCTLATLILTLIPATHQEGEQPVQHWWGSFPVATADLTLGLGEDGSYLSMMALANEYARLTGQHLVINPETRQLLESCRTGIQANVVVPPDHVQPFFETLLIESDFVLRLLRDESPRMLAIESLQTSQRHTVRNGARFVPREHLESLRDHPAMLVTTTLELPYTDVRMLSNALRIMTTDANTQQLMPAGATHSMVLTGFGPQIADLAVMFERIDERSRISWEKGMEQQKLEQPDPEAGSGDGK